MPLNGIARIQSIRSISSVVVKGSKSKVEIILASEFCDAIPGLITSHEFIVDFKIDVANSSIANSLEPFSTYKPRRFSKGDSAQLDICIPEHCAIYDITISCVPTAASESFLIVPLTLEGIEVVDAGNPLLQKASRILSCKRIFQSTLFGPIVIREEYGKTLGSHVYDSSIVLLGYLEQFMIVRKDRSDFAEEFSRNHLVLELGSGCGLLAVWLGNVFSHVVATDLVCNIDDLSQNLILNGCKNVHTMEFNWADSCHVENVKGTLAAYSSEGIVDLIIAADVLYDKELAIRLFDTIREIAVPDVTVVLIGQKMREMTSRAPRFDVQSVPGFCIDRVHDEADVVIWRLMALKAPIGSHTLH